MLREAAMNKALEPVKLRNIELKNRVVRSATQDYFGNHDGTVSEEQIKIHETLAANNIGLIITAHNYVTPAGKVSLDQNSISDDICIDGHKKQAEAVHKAGAKIIMQISHAGAGAMELDGNPPVAPSAVPIPFPASDAIPKALTVEEIEVIIQQFIDAAVRAKKAGYDGVQVHGAHQYLFSQFLNPVYNKRTDEYGGSVENRFKITERAIAGIKKELGEEFPVFLKVNSNIEENDEAYYDDLIYVARKCKDLGVEAIEYSGFNFTALGRQGLRKYYLDRVAAVRKEVDIPAILVGGIRSFKDMDEVLGRGIDMVSICRPFISEPDLISKLIAGQEESRCLSCSKCFVLPKKTGKRCVQHS